MLTPASKLNKIPLFIVLVRLKRNVLRLAIAVGVFQVQDPTRGFDAAGWLKFDVATFDHFAGSVVTFVMPGREGTFVGEVMVQPRPHNFHITDGDFVGVNNGYVED